MFWMFPPLPSARATPPPLQPTMHVARTSLAKLASAPSRNRLPLEGILYDPLTLSNFVDLDKYSLTATIGKSIPVNTLSTLLDADLPAKLSLSGTLGHLGPDGAVVRPVARAGISVRLLDLGASDTRQKGFLRFKASARTDGRRDHGFEIDRKVELFSLPSTTLYGNVTYKTSNNKSDGVKFAGRLGLTPEGDFVYDLKL